MRRSTEFTAVLRDGRRAARETLMLHYRAALPDVATAHVGLVVGRQVGGSVVRHHVSRRLREQLRHRIHHLPEGSGLVVRALPPASGASSQRLGEDLDAALVRLGLAPTARRERLDGVSV
jgi:ribonuclease P protein component